MTMDAETGMLDVCSSLHVRTEASEPLASVRTVTLTSGKNSVPLTSVSTGAALLPTSVIPSSPSYGMNRLSLNSVPDMEFSFERNRSEPFQMDVLKSGLQASFSKNRQRQCSVNSIKTKSQLVPLVSSPLFSGDNSKSVEHIAECPFEAETPPQSMARLKTSWNSPEPSLMQSPLSEIRKETCKLRINEENNSVVVIWNAVQLLGFLQTLESGAALLEALPEWAKSHSLSDVDLDASVRLLIHFDCARRVAHKGKTWLQAVPSRRSYDENALKYFSSVPKPIDILRTLAANPPPISDISYDKKCLVKIISNLMHSSCMEKVKGTT